MLRIMLREGTSEDFGSATELLNRVWPHRVGSERGLRHAAAAEPPEAHRRYWAAEVGGELVGWATATIDYESSRRPGFLQACVAPESRKGRPWDCPPRALRSPPGRPRRRDGAVVHHPRGGVAELRHRTWFPAHPHDPDLRRRPAHDRAPERPARRRTAPARRARPAKGVRARLRGDAGHPRRRCDGRPLVRAMARGLLASSGHGPRRERCGRNRRQTGRLLAPPRRPGRSRRHRHDRDAAGLPRPRPRPARQARDPCERRRAWSRARLHGERRDERADAQGQREARLPAAGSTLRWSRP